MLVQPYGEKIVHLGVKSIKSIKLGTMIVLGGLIIFSYGPHPNTHGGGDTMCPWGEGFGRFVQKSIYMVKKIVHLGVKAPNLAW